VKEERDEVQEKKRGEEKRRRVKWKRR
jgi:hypothetical protein